MEVILNWLIPTAHACVGCGTTESFTPKMLMIGMGFVLLPAGLVGYMFWRLYVGTKSKKYEE